MTEQTPSPPNGGSLIIRNRLQTPYHMRLGGDSQEGIRPYRVQLEPRGLPGDMRSVPGKFADDYALVSAYDMGIIEVVTQAEARELLATQTGRGYQRRTIPIVRPEDTQITVAKKNVDDRGNVKLERADREDTANERTQRIADATQRGVRVSGAGPNIVGSGGGTGLQGADDALAEGFQAAATEGAEDQAAVEYSHGFHAGRDSMLRDLAELDPELAAKVAAEFDARAVAPEPNSREEVMSDAEGRGWDGEELPEELPLAARTREGAQKQLTDEEIEAHEAAIARMGAADEIEDRQRRALEEKGILPEGALKPRVTVERARGEQPGFGEGIEDPYHWKNQPGSQPPEGAR